MKKNPSRSEAETFARPYLKLVIDRCASEERRPCDYVLLIGKYNAKESMVVPRHVFDEVIALAKTPGRRAKLQRLFDKPCEPSQLLVLVTAGDQIEGELIRIPTLVPGDDAVSRFGISSKENKLIDDYMVEYGPAIATGLDQEGGRVENYVAIARLPKGVPGVIPRGAAREVLEREGFGRVIGELDVPRKQNELLVFYKIAGHPSWSRLQFAPTKGDPEREKRVAEARRLYGRLESLLRKHVHSAVTKMIAAGQKLEDHLLLFSPGDDPPEVLERDGAREKMRGTMWRIVIDDFMDIRSADSLLVLYDQDGVPSSHCFEVQAEEATAPTPPLHIDANDWGKLQRDREALRKAVDRLQRLVYPKVRAVGPGSFVLFWPVIESKPPTLLVREEARAALGGHAKWARILPHLFVPTDDVLVLADVGGDDVLAFARDADWLHPPPEPWTP